MDPLNYHHLRYFWAVARDGNLTRTAQRLRVSQSALSAQIRGLSEFLGVRLFVREGRGLRLTEPGKVVLEQADRIFAAGAELVETLRDGRRREHLLRIGAVATLSRNFQDSFLAPLFGEKGLRLRLVSGALPDLIARLAGHALDLVLTNRPVQREGERPFRCRQIARQKVSLVTHRKANRDFRFPRDVARVPLLLPGPDSAIRSAFEALCERLGVEPRVLAEVDDMAMMRLLARDSGAVALLPPVVVRDELRAGLLRECCSVPGVHEEFYAVTVERRYQHPLLQKLLSRGVREILEP